MSNQEFIPANEFCDLVTDGTHDSPKKTEFGIKLVTSKNIIGGKLDLTSAYFISKSDAQSINKRSQVHKNDILLSMIGTVGEVALIEKEPDFVIKNVGLLKNSDPEKAKWIYYYLKSSFAQNLIKDRLRGTTQQYIPLGELRNLPVLKPKNEEHLKNTIEQLSSLDEKIQFNTQINQTLEQIAQAIFKSWFVDFDPVRAKADALEGGKPQAEAELAAMQTISGKTAEELAQMPSESYAELAEIAKAFPSAFGEDDVPMGWEVKRIDEIIQKIPVGKKYSSKTALIEGSIPILDQGRSGIIGYHNDESGVKASIDEPVIVFANHTCYMRLISYDFSAIQNVFAFKGKECDVFWIYLATLGKQEFVEYKGHFPDFLIKEIVIPSKELTELFGKYVKANFSKIFVNDKESSGLAKVRDLLLPRLLNGDL
ncbi:restriction endonuclease subunit S [Aggregatibacter actinomycetemcomitans]|uniref:restriction endonuclease subunit S n=1 Tax=Aggregatibacter actinomycetemcomitans TaxID=714 RepID=UPI00197B08F3|nr:restriction endonuclease subunit S [Aggregatibacter actinomycetemcomitans]MBN6082616.1 restriction endonuclease subunit S [Aggregatibacter actinomycetemcomitans]